MTPSLLPHIFLPIQAKTYRLIFDLTDVFLTVVTIEPDILDSIRASFVPNMPRYRHPQILTNARHRP